MKLKAIVGEGERPELWRLGAAQFAAKLAPALAQFTTAARTPAGVLRTPAEEEVEEELRALGTGLAQPAQPVEFNDTLLAVEA